MEREEAIEKLKRDLREEREYKTNYEYILGQNIRYISLS